MGIITRTHRSQIFTDDGREFELPIDGEHGANDPLVRDLPNGNVLVSYMLVDDDAGPSPLEDHDPWMSGKGELWQLFDDGRQRDEWIAENVHLCGSCGWDNDHHPHEDCDRFEPPNPTVNEAIDDGRFFWVEKYEHGLVRYALSGESSVVDRRWDVSPAVGFIIIDTYWNGEPADIARAVLAEYTDWCNGNVWGVIHQEYRPARLLSGRPPICEHCGHEDEHDEDNPHVCWVPAGEEQAAWNYIGDDCARSEMTAEHENWSSDG